MKQMEDLAGAGWSVLTARERDVIYPVAEGKSNKLIAMELGISMRTVEAHRARIFYKMGVRNAVQLARTVCQHPDPAQSGDQIETYVPGMAGCHDAANHPNAPADPFNADNRLDPAGSSEQTEPGQTSADGSGRPGTTQIVNPLR